MVKEAQIHLLHFLEIHLYIFNDSLLFSTDIFLKAIKKGGNMVDDCSPLLIS